MFYLMNKDNKIASFQDIGALEENFEITMADKDRLPIGMENINDWIENRKASKHNSHLREIMNECGCSTKMGFIKVTHAASLNDSFWVKLEKEPVSWEDISLYKNEFNEAISKLAFEGVGLCGIQFSDTSPELSTEGSFRKCWKRENGKIYLYKRGSSGARNAGFEPYGEVLASELAGLMCKDSTSYDLVRLNGEIASKCRLFTNETIGYVPYSKLGHHYGLDNMLSFYEKMGSEEDFRRMVVFDSLTFNVDRHTGNHGILFHNDTLEQIKMAPVFDYNMALLPYIEKEDFHDIGSAMLRYGPRIGDDFTRTGQLLLTPDIRSDLINLKGFHFSFQGDENFTKERVKVLEKLVNHQIAGILSKDKLYTRDVFVPKTLAAVIEKIEKPEAEKKQERNLLSFMEIFQKENLNVADCFINENEEGEMELNVIPKQNTHLCFILSKTFELSMTEDDYPLPYERFLLEHSEMMSFYKNLSKQVDG